MVSSNMSWLRLKLYPTQIYQFLYIHKEFIDMIYLEVHCYSYEVLLQTDTWLKCRQTSMKRKKSQHVWLETSYDLKAFSFCLLCLKLSLFIWHYIFFGENLILKFLVWMSYYYYACFLFILIELYKVFSVEYWKSLLVTLLTVENTL